MKRTVGFKAEDQIFIKQHRPEMSIRAIALVLGCSMGKVRHYLIQEGMSLERPRQPPKPKPKPKKKVVKKKLKKIVKKPLPQTIVKKQYEPKLTKHDYMTKYSKGLGFNNVAEAVVNMGHFEFKRSFNNWQKSIT